MDASPVMLRRANNFTAHSKVLHGQERGQTPLWFPWEPIQRQVELTSKKFDLLNKLLRFFLSQMLYIHQNEDAAPTFPDEIKWQKDLCRGTKNVWVYHGFTSR